VHAAIEEKNNDSKDNFYEELEQASDHFPKYHMKILLRDFNTKVGRENVGLRSIYDVSKMSA
jgi:hypothetical protein